MGGVWGSERLFLRVLMLRPRRLSSNGPQGRGKIAVRCKGAWHNPCRAPFRMAAPAEAIMVSSAAGARACEFANLQKLTMQAKQGRCRPQAARP